MEDGVTLLVNCAMNCSVHMGCVEGIGLGVEDESDKEEAGVGRTMMRGGGSGATLLEPVVSHGRGERRPQRSRHTGTSKGIQCR